ncbi:hypothetical protein JCM11641_007889 [Rhodosporidiobolus odoratus]
MTSKMPYLPPEILDLILREAFPPTAEATSFFHRVRDAHEERALYCWSISAGTSWLPFIRSLLFFAPHVGSKHRADKLSLALRLAFPNEPASKGHLAKLVKRLSLDIRERELPTDAAGKYRGADGITSLQIVELASLLPALDSLSVSVIDKGGWIGDPSLLNALKKFGAIRHLEVSGSVGWQNILSVATGLDGLETLKLKGAAPDWTFLQETYKEGHRYASSFNPTPPYSFSGTLATLVLWDCALTAAEFTALFASLAPAAHLPITARPVGGLAAPPPPSLRQLVIYKLHQRSFATQGTFSIPFDASLLISHLSPLIPHLTSLHLILYERDILSTNSIRNDLVASFHLHNGHIAALPDSGHRPGNALAALLGAQIRDLTLGGPLCVSHPALYDALDLAAISTGARAKNLTLVQCADVERPGDGLKAEGFIAALDREWATGLEKVNVRDMEFCQPSDEEKPAWGEEQLAALKAKAEEIGAERERQGGMKRSLQVLVDEDAVKRKKEEQEWPERRKKRTGSGKGGGKRGRATATESEIKNGVSGKKRKKTV